MFATLNVIELGEKEAITFCLRFELMMKENFVLCRKINDKFKTSRKFMFVLNKNN
jgi:hypothetical protein